MVEMAAEAEEVVAEDRICRRCDTWYVRLI